MTVHLRGGGEDRGSGPEEDQLKSAGAATLMGAAGSRRASCWDRPNSGGRGSI